MLLEKTLLIHLKFLKESYLSTTCQFPSTMNGTGRHEWQKVCLLNQPGNRVRGFKVGTQPVGLDLAESKCNALSCKNKQNHFITELLHQRFRENESYTSACCFKDAACSIMFHRHSDYRWFCIDYCHHSQDPKDNKGEVE